MKNMVDVDNIYNWTKDNIYELKQVLNYENRLDIDLILEELNDLNNLLDIIKSYKILKEDIYILLINKEYIKLINKYQDKEEYCLFGIRK